MRHRVVGLTAAIVFLTGCTLPTAADEDRPVRATLPAPALATIAFTAPALSAPRIGHTPDDAPAAAPSPPTVAMAPPVTLSRPGLPVEALPPDLNLIGPVSVPVIDEPDPDGAEPTPTDPDVAAAWVLARHATRSDDPGNRRLGALGALAADQAVAAASDANAPRADAATNGATWAVIHTVSDLGDGWWRVAYAIKNTGTGHVGPTSEPAALDVHVVAGQVDGEQP
jgi:hypothetical protein